MSRDELRAMQLAIVAQLDAEAARLRADNRISESFVNGIEHAAMIVHRWQPEATP